MNIIDSIDVDNTELTRFLDREVPGVICECLNKRFHGIPLKDIIIRLVIGKCFAKNALYIDGEDLAKSHVVKVHSDVFKFYTYIYDPAISEYEHTIVEIACKGKEPMKFFGSGIPVSCYFPDIGIEWRALTES